MSQGVVGSRLRGNDAEDGGTVGATSSGRSPGDEKMLALLRTSLAVWKIGAMLARADDGGVLVTLDDGSLIRVGRAPAGIPFRWMVTTSAGRERPASSVTGLLRVLRSTLDPEWRAGRARVVGVTMPESHSRNDISDDNEKNSDANQK